MHGEKVRREQRTHDAQKMRLLAAFMQYRRLPMEQALVLRGLLPLIIIRASPTIYYRNFLVCANVIQVRVAEFATSQQRLHNAS